VHWEEERPVLSKELNMPRAYLATYVVPVLLAFTASSVAAQANHSQTAAEKPAPSLNDATIVAIFDNANTADIETGQLAAKQGHSVEVRQFGAMLARDHQMVRQQGRDLAKKLGVTPTPPKGDQSADNQAALIRRLKGLQGVEFDRAFLQHEADFHRDVITAIQTTLLPATKNEELKALVVKVAPAFQAHLDMARNLGKRLAVK